MAAGGAGTVDVPLTDVDADVDVGVGVGVDDVTGGVGALVPGTHW